MAEVAKTIVNRIISDLTGRSGLENEWDSIDEDIQNEIRETWESIVTEELPQEGEK
jgi:hypothetical protein